MKLQRFLHSCLHLRQSGRAILFDPGSFSFIEGRLTPADLPQCEAVFITHEHGDHLHPEALQVLKSKFAPRIICAAAVHKILQEQGIESEVIAPGTTLTIGPFKVKAYEAAHGDLPFPCPFNMAYVVNDDLLVTGDSLTLQFPDTQIKTLTLPIAGPWLTWKQALEYAAQLQPERVVAMHDNIIKDFYLDRMYEGSTKWLKEKGIEFHPLRLGETLTV